MSENDKNTVNVGLNAYNKIGFFSLPILAIIFHYIMSNILYISMSRLLFDTLHLSEIRVKEFYYLGEILIYILLVVIFFAIYKFTTGRYRGEKKVAVNLKEIGKSIVTGFGVAGIICIIVGILGLIPALQRSVELVKSKGASESNLLGTIAVSAILAPIIEEILFRGIVFKSLKKVTPVCTAIIVSSALFGIYHMNIVSAVYATSMGVIAAIVYERKNNLIFPIFVHIGNNFLAAIQEFVPPNVVNIINIVSIIMIPIPVYVLYTFFKRGRR